MAPRRPVELGELEYANLVSDGSGAPRVDATVGLEQIVDAARARDKLVLANFVEWPGWHGCQRAGRIFADRAILETAGREFVCVAFNTWARGDAAANAPHRVWGGALAGSWWGYVRVVDPGTTESTGARPPTGRVAAGSRQLTGDHQLAEVRAVLADGLRAAGRPVPDALLAKPPGAS